MILHYYPYGGGSPLSCPDATLARAYVTDVVVSVTCPACLACRDRLGTTLAEYAERKRVEQQRLAERREWDARDGVATEIELTGVREHTEGLPVKLMQRRPLRSLGGSAPQSAEAPRWVIAALNEGGFYSTQVDLFELIAWLRVHRPEILAAAMGAP